MKMPPANSRLRRITSLLLLGHVISPQEGISYHGDMGLTLAEIAELYQDLVRRGCALQVGPRIAASAALFAKYEPPEPSARDTGPKVPPKEVPPFKPLSSKHLASSRGLRDGSNDLRDVPSHYGNCGTGKTACGNAETARGKEDA
jgi:hypothetical protein